LLARGEHRLGLDDRAGRGELRRDDALVVACPDDAGGVACAFVAKAVVSIRDRLRAPPSINLAPAVLPRCNPM
jgi:hypothetical protein